VGEVLEVLVDEPGVGRSHREAPDIDGIVHVDETLGVGEFHKVVVTGAAGPDLWAQT
jgi:ribosomal protein S12 methylthiotransferase